MRVHVRHQNGKQVVQTTIGKNLHYYPVDLPTLEICNKVQQINQEILSGNIVLCAWTNPAVPKIKINLQQNFALSYLFILYFLKLRDTRDIWRSLPAIPVKALSYLRERIFFFDNQLNYKIAILTCLHRGLTVKDTTQVMRVFRSCGLAEDNYVFYNLLLQSGEYRKLQLDDGPLILNVASIEHEVDLFAENVKNRKLCAFHAHKKLSFIAKGGNFAIDELATELMLATVATYRLCRPMRDVPYSENYARRAMTNTVNRVIFSQTKHKSKINMWQTQKGFSLRFSRLDDPSNVYDPTDDCIRESVGFTEDAMLDRIALRKVYDETRFTA